VKNYALGNPEKEIDVYVFKNRTYLVDLGRVFVKVNLNKNECKEIWEDDAFDLMKVAVCRTTWKWSAR
jgi:hypothetical protein